MFCPTPPFTPRPPPPSTGVSGGGRGGDSTHSAHRNVSALPKRGGDGGNVGPCDSGRPSPHSARAHDPVTAYRKGLRYAHGVMLDRLVVAAQAPAVSAPSPLASAARGGGIRGGSAVKPSAAALGQPAGVERLMSLWAAANPRESNFAPLGRTQVPALESAFDIHPELAQLKMRYSRLARAAIEPSQVQVRAPVPQSGERSEAAVPGICSARRSSTDSLESDPEAKEGSGRSTPAYFEATAAVETADWGRQTVAAFLRLSRPVSTRPVSSPPDLPATFNTPRVAQTGRNARVVMLGSTAVAVGRPVSARRAASESTQPVPQVYRHSPGSKNGAGRFLSAAVARPTARPCPACRERQQERSAHLRWLCEHEGGGMWHALRDADTAATAAATRHRDILHGGNTFFTVVDAGKVSLSPRRVDERMRGRYFHTIA